MLMYVCEKEYERRLAEYAANVETVAVDVDEISGDAESDPWLYFMAWGWDIPR
jgi:hypothetical protein